MHHLPLRILAEQVGRHSFSSGEFFKNALNFVSQGPIYDESHSKQGPGFEQRTVILESHFTETLLTGT